jgi:rod shape-determining protein MreC
VATRSRSARAAVLASSVQRSKPTPYPSKARSALIRRTVVVVLVLVALTLVTISFRSPAAGALHDVQGAGSTALSPFQVAATRIAQPFRDGYDYLSSLSSAKSENKKLKRENQQLRAVAIANAALAQEAKHLQSLLHFEQGQTFPDGYRPINAAVISFPGGPMAHTLVVRAGSSSGVHKNSPVVSGDGLVGIVSNVFPDSAIVTLLTDPNNFVAARDLRNGVRGGIKWGPGGTLALSQVPKQFAVKEGDEIVTDGTRNGRYPDLYPYGIPIGQVSSVGVTDTEQVQVQPFADLGALDAVAVLVPTKQNQ